MKKLLILLYCFTFCNAFCQVDSVFWERSIKIFVKDEFGKGLTNVDVAVTIENRTYHAEYSDQRGGAHYRFDSLPAIRGKIRVSKKGYDYQESPFIPVSSSYGGRKCAHMGHCFTLGKTGSSYIIIDGRKFPVTSYPNSFGIFYKEGAKDSLISFLAENGFKLGIPHVNDPLTRAEIPALPYINDSDNTLTTRIEKNQSVSESLDVLMNCEFIILAGPLMSYRSRLSFLTGEFSIKFTKFTNEEQIHEFFSKNNIEILNPGKERVGSYYRVKMINEHSNITEFLLELQNDPIVRLLGSCNVGYMEYMVIPED